ncbi:actin-like isoform X2 [Cydia strobilella]|uniref:actin-like isoform X2 n=1 Tax=Cydia strobilella TaxID=1100964 RepID=UPI003003C43D
MSDRIKVVLDVGGQWTRAGFAGESFPRAEYPSVVGRFRRTELLDGFPDVYCGREAVLKRGISLLSWPMQKGLIQDWDELEKLLHHTFYKELLVAPEETNVMYALHPLTPGKDKFPLKHSIVTSQLTGQAITGILLDLMKNIGYSFTTPTEIELAEKIKASTCYVATDLKSIQASRMADGDTKVRYQLPDGQHIILDEERFICPEVFFRPSLQGLECPSIVDDICKTISRCDIDYQPMFYDNIVLSGGGSQLAGLDKRLHRELLLRVLEQPNFRVTVDAMESRQHATWRGGSMLACMDAVKGCYLTKEEYEDSGTGRVRQKFY